MFRKERNAPVNEDTIFRGVQFLDIEGNQGTLKVEKPWTIINYTYLHYKKHIFDLSRKGWCDL